MLSERRTRLVRLDGSTVQQRVLRRLIQRQSSEEPARGSDVAPDIPASPRGPSLLTEVKVQLKHL